MLRYAKLKDVYINANIRSNFTESDNCSSSVVRNETGRHDFVK